MQQVKNNNIRRSVAIILATILSIIGFSLFPASAQAVYTNEVRYPVSHGSINRGFWNGSWNVGVSHSQTSAYSTTNPSHCRASQDHHSTWQISGVRVSCSADEYGRGTLVPGDWVHFGVCDQERGCAA